jgi:hypothetical protein
MRHNLTAVFNNRIDAQHVLEALLGPGHAFSGTRSSAHLSPTAALPRGADRIAR